MHYRLSHPDQDILGPAPAIYSSQPTTLPSAFSIMSSQDPTWHMDTGASSHLNFNASNLSTVFYKRLFSSVHVGDGKSIPVTNTGHSIIPSHHRPLHLHNVLVTPNIIKNLISVRQFIRDNNCTIKFDAFGFSVKDYLTRYILLRCDSSGDLCPVTKPSTSLIAFLSTSASTWHQRLGHPGDQVAYLLIYVDDIILTASCPALLHISADRTPTCLFLSQKKYALQLFESAHMVTCNPSRTPVDTDSKLGPEVQQICLYMHDPKEPHFAALKRILRYVRGTVTHLHAGLLLGYCVFLGDNLLHWSPQRKYTISRSSAEAEYRGVANVVAETAWVRNLLL
ncbi:ribonuclease H-like domain-containing protein [Tanacetum coccineum]